MSNPIPTVRVKTDAVDNPDGYIVINEADFDEKQHVLHDDEGSSVPGASAPAPAPAPDRMPIAALRKYLDDKGIAYAPDAKKPELQALYDADTGV